MTKNWTWEDEMKFAADNFDNFVKIGDIKINADGSHWKCVLKIRGIPQWVKVNLSNIEGK